MPGSQDKVRTVHQCAQHGDLDGISRWLKRDNSLLNAKTPVMLQTPLHAASGYNNAEIVKYLLEFRGTEKLELDAVNMYGETPLHMAVKNGSVESAKLLLNYGASLVARTKNGMSSLHLAVWHALQHGDYEIVKELIRRDADSFAKDNEGKMPLDHVPEEAGKEMLRQLVGRHFEEQTKRMALDSCREAKIMAEFEEAMSLIVGLKDLKGQLRRWARGILFDEKRRALGLQIATRRIPHMAFLGNPGTGKTMVARMLGRLLHSAGILPTEKVVEVQRTDLVGEFVGQTGLKTRRKLTEAEGGILFVDEAYRLMVVHRGNDKDFGLEALEEIMSVMDSGKLVVIFAGYREPMKLVIRSNEGFCRRVTKYFYFDDYEPPELAEILHLKVSKQALDSLLFGFKLHPSCTIKAVAELISRGTDEKFRKEMNGGLIDPMLAGARESLDMRLDLSCDDVEAMVTITMEDLAAGLSQLRTGYLPFQT